MVCVRHDLFSSFPLPFLSSFLSLPFPSFPSPFLFPFLFPFPFPCPRSCEFFDQGVKPVLGKTIRSPSGDADFFPGGPLPKLIMLESPIFTCYIHAPLWTQERKFGSNIFQTYFPLVYKCPATGNQFHGGWVQSNAHTHTHIYIHMKRSICVSYVNYKRTWCSVADILHIFSTYPHLVPPGGP